MQSKRAIFPEFPKGRSGARLRGSWPANISGLGKWGIAVILAYRPDIDGLRAVAIVPVVAFHAGFPAFSGGYVGVDVFFVISGYLITALLQREIAEGRFSILDFYERRIRRIIPALIALLLANFVVTAILFLPADFRRVPEASIAALAFVSNILLAGQVDYFAPDQAVQPLMHTWSLSVEEQFYLFFPILLFALHRYWRRGIGIALAAIALWSFAYNVAMVADRPVTAYFLTAVRIWELLVGALLATGAIPAIARAGLRSVLAALGLAMIILAVFMLDSDTPFPSFAGLLPVIGAGLVIHCAAGTAAGNLLGSRIPVFIGLISYSLYLWHWPIIMWLEYALGQPIGGWLSLYALAAIAICAVLSWWFVERPFRRAASGKRLFIGAAAGAVTIAGLAGAAQAADGWPGRFSPEALRLAGFDQSISPGGRHCHLGLHDAPRVRESCVFGAPIVPSVALVGDSHGVELAWALGEKAGRQGRSVLQMTYSSCPPGLGRLATETLGCAAFRAAALDYIRRHPGLRTVVLAGHLDRPDYRDNPVYRESYRALVAALRGLGRTVVIVYPVPAQIAPVPRMLALRADHGWDTASAGISAAAYRARMSRTIGFLDDLPGVARVRSHDELCGTGVCTVSLGGLPAYYDSHHLSMAGARFIAQRIALPR